ncbi:MAG: hypothetical protein DRJ52_09205 [Thermoprotei archaeon]|nr:MAG: hypothetical protein DRJ52_09205 [Thermoprotei archaeon]RLE98745.1 MAG: hypothetical protein DRJ63_07240 [Thermoprotei archaeon]
MSKNYDLNYLKEKFMEMLKRYPELEKVIEFHLRTKTNIASIDELFKDYETFEKALSMILGRETFTILIRSLFKE